MNSNKKKQIDSRKQNDSRQQNNNNEDSQIDDSNAAEMINIVEDFFGDLVPNINNTNDSQIINRNDPDSVAIALDELERFENLKTLKN